MHSKENPIRQAFRQHQQTAESAPAFDKVFAAAMRRSRAARRSRYLGLAAAAVVAAVAISLLPVQEEEMIYVDLEELVATTQWSAPSDSLLPEYQFDIYREMPRLFESTEPDGGTLL